MVLPADWTCQKGSLPQHDYEAPGQVIAPEQLPDLSGLTESQRRAYLAHMHVREPEVVEDGQSDDA